MGRFSGGCASRRKSRSEINVRTLAVAIVAITNSPCHQDTDSFATISRIDIMRSATRGQTCLSTARVYEPHAEFLNQHNAHVELRPVGSALRFFGEVNRAGTYFIWSPGSCRYSWGWRWSELG